MRESDGGTGPRSLEYAKLLKGGAGGRFSKEWFYLYMRTIPINVFAGAEKKIQGRRGRLVSWHLRGRKGLLDVDISYESGYRKEISVKEDGGVLLGPCEVERDVLEKNVTVLGEGLEVRKQRIK